MALGIGQRYANRGGADNCLSPAMQSICGKAMRTERHAVGKAPLGLPSRLPDKRPPDVEAECQPCRDGCRICFPVRFVAGHAMFVYLPDRELTRRTDVLIQGHVLHTFRAFFRNIPEGTSGIDRGVWFLHANPIFVFLIQKNAWNRELGKVDPNGLFFYPSFAHQHCPYMALHWPVDAAVTTNLIKPFSCIRRSWTIRYSTYSLSMVIRLLIFRASIQSWITVLCFC